MLAMLLLLTVMQVDLLSPHGEKAVVLLFVRSDCPISNRYAPALQLSVSCSDPLFLAPLPPKVSYILLLHWLDIAQTNSSKRRHVLLRNREEIGSIG